METIQHTLFKQETTYSSSRSNSRQIPVQFSSSAAECVAQGQGLDRPMVGRHNSFTVDCSRAGNNVLFVGIHGPETPCEEVHVRHEGNKEYKVSYSLTDHGQYIIFVKWGEDHIPGSPFHVQVWSNLVYTLLKSVQIATALLSLYKPFYFAMQKELFWIK